MRSRIALALLATPLLGFAQDSAPKLQFEVASIRASQPNDVQRVNIGLKLDGQQARITSFSLRDYIAMAYRVKPYQVVGPDWLQSRFDLAATLPAGSKADQIPQMVQALLVERFQLKFHREQRDFPVYTINMGKGPLLLKEVSPEAAPAGAREVAVDASGAGSANGVAVNLGNGSSYTFANNVWTGKNMTVDEIANQVERYLDKPVVNQTGLKGHYDVELQVAQEDYLAMMVRAGTNAGVVIPSQALQFAQTNTAASVFDAFDKEGLKLDSKKLPRDILVVDGIAKAPTDN